MGKTVGLLVESRLEGAHPCESDRRVAAAVLGQLTAWSSGALAACIAGAVMPPTACPVCAASGLACLIRPQSSVSRQIPFCGVLSHTLTEFDTTLVEKEGICVLDWPLDGGVPPSDRIVDDW